MKKEENDTAKKTSFGAKLSFAVSVLSFAISVLGVLSLTVSYIIYKYFEKFAAPEVLRSGGTASFIMVSFFSSNLLSLLSIFLGIIGLIIIHFKPDYSKGKIYCRMGIFIGVVIIILTGIMYYTPWGVNI